MRLDRRRVISIWLIGLVVFVALWLFPIGSRLIRVATVGVAALVGVGGAWLWWRFWAVRITTGAIAIVILLIFLLPGRARDVAKIRAGAVASLASYDGTKYIWGGENGFGIDCSGLVRRGLIDALLREGVGNWDPSLVRESFALRWNDCSALALKDDRRCGARPVFSATSVREIDHSQLLPADFVVTSDGVHTLAYLGQETWIAADPGAGQVIRLRPTDDNAWLGRPVTVLRWRIIDQ